MKINKILSSVLVGAMLVGVTGYIIINNNQHNQLVQEPKVVYTSPNFIDDFSDKRKLVGSVHNVFVGKVIKQVGTKSLDGKLPETQFLVEIETNIKGNLKGTVSVNQQGGYYENENKEKELILSEGDKLLEIGKSYMFATRYLESENWFTVIPGFGDIEINGEQKKSELIRMYKEAYQNEIVPEVLKNKK